ncbi:hypothetical protein E2C01_005190 [Portunus trituberculatus]|uniref:Uncharacterized protein n=1 Tax=Portunus trituberculatus TaxID=210409 RepID=A0A5B7CUI0_PORTR|nr:hypothetical protein [Portunus trituberculatus]
MCRAACTHSLNLGRSSLRRASPRQIREIKLRIIIFSFPRFVTFESLVLPPRPRSVTAPPSCFPLRIVRVWI